MRGAENCGPGNPPGLADCRGGSHRLGPSENAKPAAGLLFPVLVVWFTTKEQLISGALGLITTVFAVHGLAEHPRRRWSVTTPGTHLDAHFAGSGHLLLNCRRVGAYETRAGIPAVDGCAA